MHLKISEMEYVIRFRKVWNRSQNPFENKTWNFM